MAKTIGHNARFKFKTRISETRVRCVFPRTAAKNKTTQNGDDGISAM